MIKITTKLELVRIKFFIKHLKKKFRIVLMLWKDYLAYPFVFNSAVKPRPFHLSLLNKLLVSVLMTLL